jgi:branched-chain amino acid transport system substrate-binding protein
MKNNSIRKPLWLLALSVITLVGSLSSCRQPAIPIINDSKSPSQVSSGEVIDIDVNIPLTGPIASFSGQFGNGLTMGIDDASESYGIAKNQFHLDQQDNAGKPAQAVSIVQKQLLHKPEVYISGTSDMSKAVDPVVKQQNIPYFLVAFDAYLARDDKNSLRILPHYKIEGPLYVEYAKQRKAKKVYIISLNISSIEEEFAKIVEPGLKKEGIQFQREKYDFNNKDFKTLALKVKNYNPDLVIVSGFSFHLYPLIGALRNYGLVKDGSVLSTLDFVDLLHNKTPKSELSGMAFISPEFEIPGAVKGTEEWRKKYKDRFSKDPTYVEAYAYDTGRIIVAAKKKSGTANADSILGVIPYEGITGLIKLDSDGDLMTTLTIGKVSNEGKVEKILK